MSQCLVACGFSKGGSCFPFTISFHHLYSLYFYSASGQICSNYHNNYRAPPIVEDIAKLVLLFRQHDIPILMRQVFENLV